MAGGAAGLACFARTAICQHPRSEGRCASGAQPDPRLALTPCSPQPKPRAANQLPDDDAAGQHPRSLTTARGEAMTDCDAKGEREPPIWLALRSPAMLGGATPNWVLWTVTGGVAGHGRAVGPNRTDDR
jgi:hypothetical protein